MHATKILTTSGIRHSFVQPRVLVTRSGGDGFPFVETLPITLRWLALASIRHKLKARIFGLIHAYHTYLKHPFRPFAEAFTAQIRYYIGWKNCDGGIRPSPMEV